MQVVAAQICNLCVRDRNPEIFFDFHAKNMSETLVFPIFTPKNGSIRNRKNMRQSAIEEENCIHGHFDGLWFLRSF